tara:strand:+ start:1657 stop:1950 length:294 start_codon:yes stop_codon:yes gene_type:complete
MRKNGCKTEKKCWNLKVVNNGNTLFEKDYPSLKVIGEDLGFKYNRVVELATGRKKQQIGIFDSQYVFTKINKKNCNHTKEISDEVSKDVDADVVVVE